MKDRLNKLYIKIKPYLTPKMLLCFGIAWFITNGWSYVFIVLGAKFHIGWMTTVGIAYQAFLWFPFTVEKVITIAIGIWLYKLIFKEDIKERVDETRNDNAQDSRE